MFKPYRGVSNITVESELESHFSASGLFLAFLGNDTDGAACSITAAAVPELSPNV